MARDLGFAHVATEHKPSRVLRGPAPQALSYRPILCIRHRTCHDCDRFPRYEHPLAKGTLLMTEIVVAVFETTSSADAAVEDLNAARVPSAVVQRGGGESTIRDDSYAVWHSNASRWQMPL